MPACESCGKIVNSLSNVNIAGSKVRACPACASMGKTIEETGNKKHVFKKKRKEEKEYHVVSDYAEKISKAMQKNGYDVHQLSRAVAMKESSLSKFLSKKVQLDLDNARKLASFLEINLVEEAGDESVDEGYLVDENSEEDSSGFTLGDLMKK